MSEIIDDLNGYCGKGYVVRFVETTSGGRIRVFMDCEDGSRPTISVPKEEKEALEKWLGEKFPDVKIKEKAEGKE